jgi:hypothetical protein
MPQGVNGVYGVSTNFRNDQEITNKACAASLTGPPTDHQSVGRRALDMQDFTVTWATSTACGTSDFQTGPSARAGAAPVLLLLLLQAAQDSNSNPQPGVCPYRTIRAARPRSMPAQLQTLGDTFTSATITVVGKILQKRVNRSGWQVSRAVVWVQDGAALVAVMHPS